MILKGRKASAFGGTVLLGIIVFNILMFIFIAAANQSSTITIQSSGTISEELISESDPFSWFDGFRISIFGLPAWLNYFYFTFMSALTIVGGWYAFKGN